MFIDDHSELNFRGIIIKGCEGNVVRTYLVRECSVEGICSSRKKIEAVAKRSDMRTLGVIMSSIFIAELHYHSQSTSVTHNGNEYGQEKK